MDNTFLLQLLTRKRKACCGLQNIGALPPFHFATKELKKDLSSDWSKPSCLQDSTNHFELHPLACEMNWQCMYSDYSWVRKRRNSGWKYVEYNFILMVQHVWGDQSLCICDIASKQSACSHWITVSTMVFLLIVVEETIRFRSVLNHLSKPYMKLQVKNLGNTIWI